MKIISFERAAIVVFLCVCAVSGTLCAQGMQNQAGPGIQVGNVAFPISCSKTAEEEVQRGIAMFHSFLFENAENEFLAAAKADPTCAMAYWAQAMGLYRPLAYRPSQADMTRGWDIVQQAEQRAAKTARERDYVNAVEVLYRSDGRNYATRNHEYSEQMEKIHAQYPDDTEAAVIYALSLLTWAGSDHPVNDAERAIAILNPIFTAHPDHPGVAHYIIHAADRPQLAQEGLAAAKQYAKIAPAAPHALHMPSHIFARLGLWREDIQSNLASLHAAQNPDGHVGAEHQLHAMEFLEYAYLQIGEVGKAQQMVAAQRNITYVQVDPNLHDYVNRTWANSPALLALETRDWKSAEALKPDASVEPYNQAITYWAKAVAAGHLHDVAKAQHAVDQYEALMQATERGAKPIVAEYMTTRRDEARAWLLFAQSKGADGAALLKKLADKQDVEGKGEVEIPAREMLADMLLEMNRPADALHEYQKSMRVDPNRFNGLYGAARAAELLRDVEKEQSYYRQLVSNCDAAIEPRPELLHARQILKVTCTN